MKKCLLFPFLVISLITVLSSCPAPVDTTPAPVVTPPPPLFQDKFEYSPTANWTPTGNWTSMYGSTWKIVSSGVTGNALEFPPSTNIDGMLNSYTGSDYKVSVRVRVAVDNSSWPIYVIARAQDVTNFYMAEIYDDTDSYLRLERYVAGSNTELAVTTFKTGTLDNSIYYTLTIQVQGSTITATCTGGGATKTISATDTTFINGKVGFMVWTGSGPFDVLFDDFTVRAN
jgi:hypothetical protein